ncbi:MAG TPA: amino acid adenylation domain-containing protein, partial [Longimicrobiaceae bacterium]
MENVESIYPLSPMQLDILLRSLRAPEMAEYTEQICWTMEGDLDAPAFERAWQALVDRQPVLRTVFFWEGLDTPLQVVRQKVEVRVEVRDWRDVPPAEREERVERLVRSERRGFDLEAAPLFRVACVRTGERTYRVAWSCHHLLLDGWSSGVALRELFAFYDAFRTGGVAVLDPPPSFQAYVSWLQAQPVGDAEAFWRASLAGVEAPTALPVGHAHDPRAEEAPGQAEATLPASLAERLRETAQRRQLTLNTLFQGAWALLLARYAGEDDVVFGTVSSGRPATLPRADSTLGVFLGTVPVRVRVDPDAALAPWLKEIQADQARARQHDHFSLRQIQEWSGVPAGERLFDTLLLFQNFPFREVESARVAGLELRDVHHAPARTALGHALMLEVSVRQDVVLNLSYDGNRFDAATADRVLEHLRVLLEQVADDPDRRLSELSPLSAAERARVLKEWSAGAAELPCLPVYRLVEAQAARTPDAPAVVAAEGTLTYAELERRSGRLARFLAGRGVGPDRRVGVCMERGHELVVAVLAVLRAGGCYVPLDPAYPAERLAYMLGDSGAAVLVTQAQLAGALPPTGAEVLCVDALRERIAEEPAGPPLVEADAESLAYVIYTSGSTGRPKGVAMPHRALANLLAWQEGEWRGPRAGRTLQFASASFDVSFQEVFSTWAAGGTLVIPTEEERRDPDALLRLMEAEGVERCFLPPVALQQVAERGAAPSRLREVVTAGEQLRVTEAVRGWLGALRAPLHNQYGPTETHVVTSGTLEGDPGAWPLLPPIGGPVANTRSLVLDARMEPVPAGVPGELYVGGVCLARGYLDRPDATAERFLPDPFAGEPGARVYRTGDRVRWLADGTLEFLGRADQQVKVRGFRVEPGEVEAVLEEHPAVRAAAVVAREDAPGERRLVGYVVPDGAAPSAAELRAWLRERLPEHMVPSALVALDALPLTPSGKTDRRALPAPEGGAADGEHVAPRTPTEETLAGIWAAVLKTGRVGVHDDFAALGGHSLLATRVVSRAREALGTELPVRAMFEAPTVAALAERVEEARRAGAAARTPPLVPVPRDGSPLPLSFAQQRLWFIDRLEPGRAAYNMPYPLRVRGALELRALERALTAVVRRHEPLRTRFPVARGEPVQHVDPPRPVRLPVVDLTRPADAAREAELARLVADEARRPFDLAAGPVLRTTAVRLGPDDAALLFTLHHVVSDGWSLGVLVREVSALYAGGDEARLPELPVQYADYALWQREHLKGETLERQLAWWKARLAGAPTLLELPTDRP